MTKVNILNLAPSSSIERKR